MPRLAGTGQRDIDVTVASGLGVLISGQHVYVESGVNVIGESGLGVLISGQHVYVESGVFTASGVGVQIQSGAGVLISGQHVYVESGVSVIAESGLGVLISGQHIYQESGAWVVVESGIGVTVASGLGVLVSGQHLYQESGAYTTADITVPANVIIQSCCSPRRLATAVDYASLSFALNCVTCVSAAIISLTVKAHSANSGDIYLGGFSAPNQPLSGCGFMLEPGEAINIDIDNFADVWGVTEVSGDRVITIAVK